MSAGMTLRSFHIPNWMARELKMLAFLEEENQAELVRRMIAHGLADSWATRPPNNANEPRVIGAPVPDRDDVSTEARTAMGHV